MSRKMYETTKAIAETVLAISESALEQNRNIEELELRFGAILNNVAEVYYSIVVNGNHKNAAQILTKIMKDEFGAGAGNPLIPITTQDFMKLEEAMKEPTVPEYPVEGTPLNPLQKELGELRTVLAPLDKMDYVEFDVLKETPIPYGFVANQFKEFLGRYEEMRFGR